MLKEIYCYAGLLLVREQKAVSWRRTVSFLFDKLCPVAQCYGDTCIFNGDSNDKDAKYIQQYARYGRYRNLGLALSACDQFMTKDGIWAYMSPA